MIEHDGPRSRKWRYAWISTSVTFLTATGLLWFGKLSSGEWVDLLKWLIPLTMAAYGASNVGERMAARPKG